MRSSDLLFRRFFLRPFIIINFSSRHKLSLRSNFTRRNLLQNRNLSNDKKYANETELPKYIWDLKVKKRVSTIKLEILKRAATYMIWARRCNLCMEEKLSILKANKRSFLNKRSELVSKCRQQNKFSISKFSPVEESDDSSSLPRTIATPPMIKKKAPPDTYSVAWRSWTAWNSG